MEVSSLNENIFSIQSDEDFNDLKNKIWQFQKSANPIYNEFISNFNERIILTHPFLPISFYKTKKVLIDDISTTGFFESSGTSSKKTSKHYYSDLNLYENSFTNCFERFYGPITNYCIIAILPSYIDREHSSLAYMASKLIQKSKNQESGFYLDKLQQLPQKLDELKTKNKKILLLGVTFALLDIAEKYPVDLNGHIVMETGGMKGRRKEITRMEVHEILQNAFNVNSIHSEYGMTELFSQAYSKENGIFYCPPWMKIIITEIHDPFKEAYKGKTGIINVIDLANINSCCFIATQDLGRELPDGGFKVLGRTDNSEMRGCNMLAF